MTIEEKYRIHLIGGKRYYEADLEESLPLMDDCVPFLFKYRDLEIKKGAWGNLVLEVVQALDKENPKTEEQLLSIEYGFSNQAPFSKMKRTNHLPYKNLWLNVNHSATHSMMSLQTILRAYGVDLSECSMLIRRHHNVEPDEVREYYEKQNLELFAQHLRLQRYQESNISSILKNALYVQKVGFDVDSSYNNLLLFDDYYLFTVFKRKVMDIAKAKWFTKPNILDTFSRTLSYFDDYYRHLSFCRKLPNLAIPEGLTGALKTEIENLFVTLKTDVVTMSKLFSRMKLLYPSLINGLGECADPYDLLQIARCKFRRSFYFSDWYVSDIDQPQLTNDEVIMRYALSKDEFTVQELNAYADKMHLKRLDNYLKLIQDLSSNYVEVAVGHLVKKDTIVFTYEQCAAFKKEIDYYLNSFGPIDSKKFYGYSDLPVMAYKWSGNLLAGLIRSYFADDYVLETIGSSYDSNDFIVRKRAKQLS